MFFRISQAEQKRDFAAKWTIQFVHGRDYDFKLIEESLPSGLKLKNQDEDSATLTLSKTEAEEFHRRFLENTGTFGLSWFGLGRGIKRLAENPTYVFFDRFLSLLKVCDAPADCWLNGLKGSNGSFPDSLGLLVMEKDLGVTLSRLVEFAVTHMDEVEECRLQSLLGWVYYAKTLGINLKEESEPFFEQLQKVVHRGAPNALCFLIPGKHGTHELVYHFQGKHDSEHIWFGVMRGLSILLEGQGPLFCEESYQGLLKYFCQKVKDPHRVLALMKVMAKLHFVPHWGGACHDFLYDFVEKKNDKWSLRTCWTGWKSEELSIPLQAMVNGNRVKGVLANVQKWDSGRVYLQNALSNDSNSISSQVQAEA